MKSWNEIRKNAAKCVAVVHCVIVGFSFNTETQRHKVSFPFIVRHLSSSSAPLPLCVKIILSESRDSFPNLVNPVNPVKKVCLCVKRRFKKSSLMRGMMPQKALEGQALMVVF